MEAENNATISAQGKAPKRRFINPKDPTSGEWLYTQVQTFTVVGDMKDWERQRVEAQLAHKAPYAQAELEALQMENMPNFSRGDLDARVSDEERKWTDLATSHNGLWEVFIPGCPPELEDRINSQFAEVLNTTWSAQGQCTILMQLMFRQFSTWGIGPLLWTDCYDPIPVARIASDFKFTPGTRIDMGNFSECCFYDKIRAQDLYRAVEDNEYVEAGWNKEQVLSVLKNKAEASCQPYFLSLEKMELALRDGNNPWNKYQSTEIEVIHVWVEEFDVKKDGKSVSYMLLARASEGWVILREKAHEYVSPREFLVLATDRVGSDGTIGGLRGLGLNIRAQCETNDILGCAAAYAAFISSVERYQANNAAQADLGEQMRLMPNGLMVPNGLTEFQSTATPKAAMEYMAFMNNDLDGKQGRYTLNSPDKGGVQRTAEESRNDAAKEGDVRSSQILPLTVTVFTPLGENFKNRLVDYPRVGGKPMAYPNHTLVEEFDRRMAQTDIPKIAQALQYNPIAWMRSAVVAFNSSNTPGGLDKKLLRCNESLKWMPYMTSQGQRDQVVNGAMVALYGWKGAQPYLNKSEDDLRLQGYAERVTSESATLLLSGYIPVLEFQDHIRHLGPLDPQATVGHCASLMQKLEMVKSQQTSPFEADPLDGLGEAIDGILTLKNHIEQHLLFAMRNPALAETDATQPYFKFVADVERQLIMLSKAFEKELASRQQQGAQGDPKVQAIMMQTVAKINAMKAITEAQIQDSRIKHNVKTAQQLELSQTRSQLKTAQTIQDMAIQGEKAKADAVRDQADAVKDLTKSVVDHAATEDKIAAIKKAKAAPAKKPAAKKK